MAGKLAGNVYVGERWYGPGDDVPADVAKQISNPKAWETPPTSVKKPADK